VTPERIKSGPTPF